VDLHATGSEPVYGLNTGLGGNLEHRLEASEMTGFQARMLAGRTVGTGEPLPEVLSRAALLARIIGVSRAGAGLSPAVLDLMIAMAARGLAPVIPSRGSLGAGDLVLGASMGAALIGQGEMWQEGRRVPSDKALHSAGLMPAVLAPKDAITLANHSAVTIALSAHVVERTRRLIDLAMGIAALSGEGYAMNVTIFDERLHEARPAACQRAAAAWFRQALAGSALYDSAPARMIQDALSFRTLAPVFGTVRSALAVARSEIEIELNAAADNPLVLAASGEILSTPNFYTLPIALSLDQLAIVLAHAAVAGAQRVTKLMTPHFSGLPKYLSPAGGASAGFVPMQKTASALAGEIRLKAQPASIDALPVSDAVEDVAPHTPLAARKLGEQLDQLRSLIGVEAVVAAQAVDLRAPSRLGAAGRMLHQAIRSRVRFLHDDRATGPDIERGLEELEKPEIVAALAGFW
jgi:histidine ammonia-lyase